MGVPSSYAINAVAPCVPIDVSSCLAHWNKSDSIFSYARHAIMTITELMVIPPGPILYVLLTCLAQAHSVFLVSVQGLYKGKGEDIDKMVPAFPKRPLKVNGPFSWTVRAQVRVKNSTLLAALIFFTDEQESCYHFSFCPGGHLDCRVTALVGLRVFEAILHRCCHTGLQGNHHFLTRR
jgi:hypothetical protein